MEPGIYRVSDGAQTSPAELFGLLEESSLVYIGESHDNEVHHEIQAEILEGLMRRAPGRVALGMEMFQRPYQKHLDAFIAGDIDESKMLELTDYEKRWGFDFAFYRPLMQMAASQGSAVLALNASRELTKRVKEVGFDGLNEAEAAMIPPSVLERDERHFKMFADVMSSAHAELKGAQLERFYRVQVVWDGVMADSVVRGLEARPSIEVMVVIAGAFHVKERLGIPRHVEALGGPAGVVVIPMETSADAPILKGDVVGSGVGDFVWIKGNR
jgi:uncharacterized iron-regulated protein